MKITVIKKQTAPLFTFTDEKDKIVLQKLGEYEGDNMVVEHDLKIGKVKVVRKAAPKKAK